MNAQNEKRIEVAREIALNLAGTDPSGDNIAAVKTGLLRAQRDIATWLRKSAAWGSFRSASSGVPPSRGLD
jgi:hypothetical protein